MVIPEKYKKYNLIPKTLENGADIIIHDDEYLEKLEKKINKELVPYKYRLLSDYMKFIEKEEELNLDYRDDFDRYIQNLIEVNDVSNWSVVQYILPTQKTYTLENGTKIEPTFIQGKYYFMICAKNVEESYSIYTIDEQETVRIDYLWPISCFEVIEDPSGEIENHFNYGYAVEERKKFLNLFNKVKEKEDSK